MITPKKVGVTERQAVAAENKRADHCSFADVKRACHRWLMERDPIYRQQHQAWADQRSKAATFTGF